MGYSNLNWWTYFLHKNRLIRFLCYCFLIIQIYMSIFWSWHRLFFYHDHLKLSYLVPTDSWHHFSSPRKVDQRICLHSKDWTLIKYSFSFFWLWYKIKLIMISISYKHTNSQWFFFCNCEIVWHVLFPNRCHHQPNSLPTFFTFLISIFTLNPNSNTCKFLESGRFIKILIWAKRPPPPHSRRLRGVPMLGPFHMLFHMLNTLILGNVCQLTPYLGSILLGDSLSRELCY